MAGFRQHVTVSTVLGVGYGAAAYFGLGIDWPTCVIAGGMTGLAGMFPDLDSPTGQPVREVMSFAAAMVPLLVLKRLGGCIGLIDSELGSGQLHVSHEMLVVLMAVCYFVVRLGGAWLLGMVAVHRGMFHSIPAALIVALMAFLLCDVPHLDERLFIAGGSLVGFLSHLIMDELWSVAWSGGHVAIKKSAGTAFKLFSHSVPATVTTYGILLGLSYLALEDPSLSAGLKHLENHPGVPKVAAQWLDRVDRSAPR